MELNEIILLIIMMYATYKILNEIIIYLPILKVKRNCKMILALTKEGVITKKEAIDIVNRMEYKTIANTIKQAEKTKK